MALFATNIPRNPTINIGLKFPSRKPFGHLKFVSRNNIKAAINNVEDSPSFVQPLSLPKEPITRTNIHKPHYPLLKLDKEFITMKEKKVNEALEKAIPLQHPEEIHKAMRYALLSHGKRIRPILCLASCELVGGDEHLAMPSACAVEMIHATTLIFDDLPCMDNDHIRRGKPTTHKVFGEETAILAAGALLSLSFQHVAEKTKELVSIDRVVRAIIELGSAVGSSGFMGGQLLDLRCEGKEISLKELEYIHVNKAAKLIEASVVCGAIIGGGNEMEVERLRKYSRCLGLAFQILDDIQGITKSSEELGKTAKKDLESDKATYPKFMGLEESKRLAGMLVGQAMEEITLFDASKAAPFFYWANYMIKKLAE